MKKIIINIITLLIVTSLVACDCKVDVNPVKTNEVTPTTTQTVNPSYGLFDNVSAIKITSSFEITFNNKEALNEFIDDISIIEEYDEVIPKYGRFEAKVNSIEELDEYKLFNLGFTSLEDEELLDMRSITLQIEYADDRNPSKIYEFIDGYPDVFENGDGLKVVYDGQTTFYENKDNIIARKVVDMIKDEVHYVQLYDEQGYAKTEFLHPYKIQTDDYSIIGSYYNSAFYNDYWADYISDKNFTIYAQNNKSEPTYDREDIVEVMPLPDNEKKYNLYLVDEKGHTYQYAYNRRNPYTCIRDEENPHRYYLESE